MADPALLALWSHPTCEPGSSGRLLSVTPAGHYSRSALATYFEDWASGPAAYGFVSDTYALAPGYGGDSWVVKYCTTDADGAPIVGSGLLGLPRTFGRVPTVVYHHGTAVTRLDTPSNIDPTFTFDGPSVFAAVVGAGLAILQPDGTGFGSSGAPRHRYLHADSEAAAGLDMLRAVRCWWWYQLWTDGRMFNYGFSAGGHAAVAFQRAAEAAGERFEATVLVGAVLAPEPWLLGLLGEEDPYLQVYTSFATIAANDVYGDVYGDAPALAFADPATVDLFDGEHLYNDVIAGLPASAADLFVPDLLDALLADPDAPLWVHLRDNAVDVGCLGSDVRWLHSRDDGEVPVTLAQEVMAGPFGACPGVVLEELDGLDHLNAWHQTLPGVVADLAGS